MNKINKSVVLKQAFCLNTALTCIQFAIGITLNSSAVIADGFNNLRDSLTISVAIGGNSLCGRHRKRTRVIRVSAAVLNACIVGLVIIVMFAQAIAHINNPSKHLVGIPIIISGILSIVVNGRVAFLVHKDHHEASTIALIGIVASISGGLCVALLGIWTQIGADPSSDGAIGVVIATISLIAAIVTSLLSIRDSKHHHFAMLLQKNR